MFRQGKNKKNNYLIAVEGLCASGKSKNIEVLKEWLEDNNHDVIVIEWNTNSIIRRIVFALENLNLLNSFIYSIFQCISFIIDYFCKYNFYLKKGYTVIADRYSHTAITRDKANGLSFSFFSFIYFFARKPDVVFFIDTPPILCSERIRYRKKVLFHTNKKVKKDKVIENKTLHYLELLHKEYLNLFNKQNIIRFTDIIFTDNELSFMFEYLTKKLNIGCGKKYRTASNE